MAETQSGLKFEYRVYGDVYRVVCTVDPSGSAQVTASEQVEGQPMTHEASEKLDDQAREEWAGMVQRFSLGSWEDKKLPPGARAALIRGGAGTAWDTEALSKPGSAQQLREWVEAKLHPALRASELAKKRAAASEAEGKLQQAAAAYRQAVLRLEEWYLPNADTRDETGTRFVNGKVAEKHHDYARAVNIYKQVLAMRLENYQKKYEM